MASSAYAFLLSGEERSLFCALTWDASPVGWAALATHNTPALLRLAAPSPVDCDAGGLSCRTSEAAAAAAAGQVLAGRLVVDVNYTDLGQTVQYGSGAGTELCIVGRIYDGCL